MDKISSANYYKYGLPMATQRGSLLLQMLLQANLVVFLIWCFGYLLQLLHASHSLWNYQGLALLLCYVLAVAAESVRLYACFAINLSTTGASTMWLLLTLTPCVLLPSLVYLRLGYANPMLLARCNDLWLLLLALEVLLALVQYLCCNSSQQQQQQLDSAKTKSLLLAGLQLRCRLAGLPQI
ncbi:uncharacterized protein LOC108606438 [Drosophila busckii]|uniref:uncharacterized protein LOC108606438 n=1 Tax=Drosophila busckii TaxID=30019 RepID=UPI00083EA677|nr:uncharacterized protein LOC108606438 [Drosophila busckii]